VIWYEEFLVKVGSFTPRAIRHVRPNLQVSSSGVISSYLWVLSL
jgi:hypothetical protein